MKKEKFQLQGVLYITNQIVHELRKIRKLMEEVLSLLKQSNIIINVWCLLFNNTLIELLLLKTQIDIFEYKRQWVEEYLDCH